MTYRECAQLKFSFTSIIILLAGFTVPLKAQSDTTVIEETDPMPVPAIESMAPQDSNNRQTAVDTIPDQSFTAPDYSGVRDSYTVSQVPNPKEGNGTGYISDPNDYLSTSDEYRINNILYKIEKTSTAQVAVVFVPNIP